MTPHDGAPSAPRSGQERELRDGLRLISLSAAQRRRHLDLLNGMESEEREMDFVRRRSRAEMVAVLAVVLLAVTAAAVWNVVLDDSGGADDSDDLLAGAGATLTARALVPAPAPTDVSAETATPMLPVVEWNGVCIPDTFVTNLPADVPASDPSFPDWYGSRESDLWVAPLFRNALLPQELTLPTDRWFAGGKTYLMWYGTTDPIDVAGQRLDGSGSLEGAQQDGTNPQVRAQWTSFVIPEPGCWAITGSVGDRELTIVAEVLPHDERPDVIAAQRIHAAKPYPAPDTCPESPWTGPEARFDAYTATYWLEDVASGMAASEQMGWMVAEQRHTLLVSGVQAGDAFAAWIQLQDDATSRTEVSNVERLGDERLVRVTFPETGCWTVELVAGARVASFTVYVYPLDCFPDIAADTITAPCSKP